MVEKRMTNSIVLTTLDDESLLDAAKRLATEERRATAALLRALMEIDTRRLYLRQGCASMFAERVGISRQTPAAVRRQVWRRDGGRCAFVGAHGRCRERAFIGRGQQPGCDA